MNWSNGAYRARQTMFLAPTPDNEAERLAVLRSYGILDTLPEQSYEDITKLAAFICETPISLVSLIDTDRQWFKAERGLGARETPRSQSFCANTLVDSKTLVVPDARTDSRFKDNPLVLGDPNIRFYAGAPIIAPGGQVMGTVCVIDTEPRELSPDRIEALEALARQVMVLLEQRTAISRAEKALDLSKEVQLHRSELAAIVDSSDDAILSKDLNGIITSWNIGASRIFGYSSQEMVGESILRLIPEELHSDETHIIGKIRAGERLEHFETVRVAKDGRRIDVALTVSPIRDATGKVIGASKILRDISSQKQIEKTLLQAEKIAAAGRMASTIAHEVNNPLEAITNLLYLLRPFIVDMAGLKYLATAESEIARVSNIAKQTLGFYHEHTAASSLSVSQLVQNAVEVYKPRCALNGIAIEQSLTSIKKIYLRRGEMMQVVSNLMANAIYAMPAGGTLSISTEDVVSENECVLLTIQDTGVGIAAQNISKVFDAFFTTRGAIGTGIGLFVAKQFVEGHGGQIELESNDDVQQHGTALRVYLPIRTPYESNPLP